MTRGNLFVLALCVIAALAITSCVEKRGCTSSYADNYDPEATQDDDTCIPTRDKFVGTFEANGTIEGQDGPGLLTPYDDVWINVEDSTVASQEGVVMNIIGIDPTFQILPLDAVISGTYTLNVIRQELDNITYYGDGNVNGRVLELYLTRLEKIINPDETFYYDTLFVNVYGIKELEP